MFLVCRNDFVDEHLRKNRLFLTLYATESIMSVTYMLATKVLDKVNTTLGECITTIDHLKELNVVDSETRMKLDYIIAIH
jgi:hypothetical protein